jgi:copper chaperone CopZ
MRYSFIGLLVIVSASLLLGCGGMSTSIQLSEEAGTEIREYEVFGMDCPGCHGGLEKLINKLPGVIESKANWEEKSLFVRLPEGSELTDDAVFQAIRDANFTPGQRNK